MSWRPPTRSTSRRPRSRTARGLEPRGLGQEKDPEGGPFEAYPSGKTWDQASGATGVGKKFFHNYIEGSKVKSEPFYVAIITPVIHYCMGGHCGCLGTEKLRRPGDR